MTVSLGISPNSVFRRYRQTELCDDMLFFSIPQIETPVTLFPAASTTSAIKKPIAVPLSLSNPTKKTFCHSFAATKGLTLFISILYPALINDGASLYHKVGGRFKAGEIVNKFTGQHLCLFHVSIFIEP